ISAEAVRNFEKAGTGNVKFIKGKVEDILPELISKKEKFDIIFQDSGKYLYPLMLENTVKLCKKGGVIIADDTLFRVIETVRSGLGDYTHDYNRAVFAHKKLFSTIIPIGHGLTLSLKK
ncbi:MAG TPA: O-methyltransferase, partial [bacterium]|nr:O-methyltransferase [bacterium]